MFVKLFKSKFPFKQILAIFIIMLLLWARLFFDPLVAVQSDNNIILFDIINNLFAGYGYLSIVLSFLLIFAEGILLNIVLTENNIVQRNSFFPAVIYVLLMGSSNILISLHPVLFANLFLILILRRIFQMQFSENNIKLSFEIGFYLAIASMFYFPVVFLMLFIWAALIVLQLYVFRFFLITLIGFLLPYIYLGSYYFLTDNYDVYINYLNFFSLISLHDISLDYSIVSIVGRISILIVFAYSLISLLSRFGEISINSRKMYVIIFWYLIFTVLVALMGVGGFYRSSLLVLPITIFMANHFSSTRRSFWAELIFSLLIAGIFIGKFINFAL